MYEGPPFVSATPERLPEKELLKKYDFEISELIVLLETQGLKMKQWSDAYEALPESTVAFEEFYDSLQSFKEKRQDALASLEFSSELLPIEIEKIRQFDRDVMSSFKDFDNFLGNGATAEVYGMSSNDAVCVKFITDQARYNENNSIRVEYDRLSQVYHETKLNSVRVPTPYFLRIHAKDGHAFGMEKIHGASLSQLLDSPDQYPELIAMALSLDSASLEKEILTFISLMHKAGVTHCDMYKRNIMLDETGQLRVIDFGKAKIIDFEGDREDERKSDLFNARQSLQDFFNKIRLLTKEV